MASLLAHFTNSYKFSLTIPRQTTAQLIQTDTSQIPSEEDEERKDPTPSSPQPDSSSRAPPISRTESLKALLRNPFGSRNSRDMTSVSSENSSASLDGPEMPTDLERRNSYHPGDDACSRGSANKSSPLTKGTFDYTVQDGDKLRSIAARFDMTPSILKRVNKMTSDLLFSGQVIKIPDKDYVYIPTSKSHHGHLSVEAWNNQESQSEKKGGEAMSPPLPGRIMRMDVSCHSLVDEDVTPKALSTDEAQYLDKECFQRFIKISSFYITEHYGSVDGTLLVTPNAVMFDPNLSHALVLEKGAEEFGMIAQMETIMSVAIYHDMEAIEKLQRRKSDKTVEHPEVYRAVDSKPDTENAVPSQTPDDSCSCDTPSSQQNPLLQASSDNKTKSSSSLSSAVLLDPAALVSESPLQTNKQSANTNLSRQTSSQSSAGAASPDSEPLSDGGDKSPIFSCEPVAVDEGKDLSAPEILDGGDGSNTGEKEKASGEFSVVEFDLSSTTQTVGNSSFYICVDTSDEDSPSAVRKVKLKKQRTSSRKPCSPPTPVEMFGAVGLEERPGLFQSLSEMIPQGLVTDAKPSHTDEPSLYLCVRVGRPVNKCVSTNCPIASYSRKKRPEYWFSVPRDKVDQLYAFFIQWKSEAYGKEVGDAGEIGFIALTDENATTEGSEADPSSPKTNCPLPDLSSSITKDWEIVSLDEVRRRQTLLDIEKYLPLPELVGESCVFTEQHLRQLMKVMPGRVEGYPWTLAFGTEAHGFSLSTMYRNLQGLDNPVLLVIKTTQNQVFGALSSHAFHMSDTFYGTGESFLYTFVDGYKTYPWSGVNNLFNKGDQNCLSIGAGEGSYGIWIDGDIYLGRTQNCLTYANDPLTGSTEDFHIEQMEVWSFHDNF